MLMLRDGGGVDRSTTLAEVVQLALTHCDREGEAGHRDAHPADVDVSFVVQTRHNVTNVLFADADRARELVEANGTSLHLRARKVTKDVSRDGLKRLVMKR